MTALNIRLFIITVMALVTFVVLRRKIRKITLKKLLLIFFAFNVVFVVLRYIPFESPFVKFDNLESAFRYAYNDKEILKTIELDNATLVIYEQSDYGLGQTIIPRKSNGWGYVNPAFLKHKLMDIHDLMFISSISNQEISKTVVVVKQYFLGNQTEFREVLDMNGNAFNLEEIEWKKQSNTVFVYWICLDSNETSDFSFTIDGSRIELK